MRILHITSGDPKTHQGGLNRYCNELMQCEKQEGHVTVILYPGNFGSSGKTKIIKKNNDTYMIKNALPVAITYGINEPRRYIKNVNIDVYKNWLKSIMPTVIHVHSIQGIHKEFFYAAKIMGIPLVFTTHDYYPICLRCTLVNKKGILCDSRSAEACALCNVGCGLSKRNQVLHQSGLYQSIKKVRFVSTLKKFILNSMINVNRDDAELNVEEKLLSETKKDYNDILEYNYEILSLMDVIHCNSELTKQVYLKFFPNAKYKTIAITHSGLVRKTCTMNIKETFNFGYMGGKSRHKGFSIVESAFDLLEEKDVQGWDLWLYGGDFSGVRQHPRKHYEGYFGKDSENDVWDKLDVLIVASQWRETFGFVVLEALSRGIPVICSDLVGSGYLVEKIDSNLIFRYDSIEQLCTTLIYIMSQDNYRQCCEKINNMDIQIDMKIHTGDILGLYEEVLNMRNGSN